MTAVAPLPGLDVRVRYDAVEKFRLKTMDTPHVVMSSFRYTIQYW
jgi:hypothetical protein